MTDQLDRPTLPGSLADNPRLSGWLRFGPDRTVLLRTGKVEIGQGILTALAQVAAEELDVDLHRVRVLPADTATGPDEGLTAGSRSVEQSGAAVRAVCAEARAVFLALAATRLGVPAAALTVHDGQISADGRGRTSYWELAADAASDGADPLDCEATGTAPVKGSADYRVVGTAAPRVDIPDKVSGRPRFVTDLDLPGLCFGRVVRPPSPGARLVDLADVEVRARPGVLAVVREGSFVGVVAEREEVAVAAADALRRAARWDTPATLPDENALADFLTRAPATCEVVAEQRDPAAAARVTRTVSATYSRPFTAHASIGPSAAAARWDGDGTLSVWSHSQGIFALRAGIASELGLDPRRVVVRHVEGPGAYGHNGADDAAFDAALLAGAVPGRPVLLQWSRQDEMAWEPYGPAMVVRLSAGLDDAGGVHTWRHEVWGNGHVNRPRPGPVSRLLAAAHRTDAGLPAAADPPLAGGGGSTRNAVPGYAFGDHRVTSSVLSVMPLRTSSLRALGATANVFAIESFMDELAAAAGVDPVAWRLRYLRDPRGRAVVEAAARRAGWGGPPPGESCGRGIGYARYKNRGAYCAVVAEVEAVHEVRVRRLTVAADVGLAVNPDGVANQFEGGAVQATSWALKERVRFDRTRVTSDTWEGYPILRFSEVPTVDVQVLQRPDEPSLGAGEAAQGPTVAAIANALAAALGVRVRDLPLTPERVVAAVEDQAGGLAPHAT